MARLGSERHPSPTPMPTKLELELRELARSRTLLVEKREAFVDHARKSRGESKTVDSVFANLVKQINQHIERLEKRMRKLVESDARKKADVARLKQIFGVGELTAMLIIAELLDLRRFKSSRQLAAYCGLTPRVTESGQRKGQAHMSKIGNPHVRRALYMAAVVNVGHRKTDLADWYHRRVEQGMHKMKALAVVMRRILDRMYLLATTDVIYQRRPLEGV
jgi:transposase